MNPGLTYRESAAAGASPVKLVVLLYEQAIKDLHRALDAHARGDIETRTREINHAILVVGHLQATLDIDRGGTVAENLSLFYEHIRGGLMQAQCRQSATGIEEQISHLTQVHEAWCKVEKELAPQPVQVAETAEQRTSSEWKA